MGGKEATNGGRGKHATRGGLVGKCYPWGDEIGKTKTHYGWNEERGITKAVGSFEANGYGLYDMAAINQASITIPSRPR